MTDALRALFTSYGMSKKFKNKTCAYCSVPGSSETGDHVIAREFFLPARRENLLLGGTHVDLLRNEFALVRKEAADFEKEVELVLVEAGADCGHTKQGHARCAISWGSRFLGSTSTWCALKAEEGCTAPLCNCLGPGTLMAGSSF